MGSSGRRRPACPTGPGASRRRRGCGARARSRRRRPSCGRRDRSPAHVADSVRVESQTAAGGYPRVELALFKLEHRKPLRERRIGEALGLDLADVDLESALLRIRETKFYKTRIVPVGADLTRVLRDYLLERSKGAPIPADGPFLLTRQGKRPSRAGAEEAFKQLRRQAKVSRIDGSRYQPRLHDMRHTYAVTRLVRWYRDGADVQRLLPQLATYLGHVHISGMQRYLTMTPELLRQASLRFERYALGGKDHA